MKKIYNIKIDTSDMPNAATVRTFQVDGEKGAEFILCVLENDSIKYYDFIDNSFELGHNDKNNNLRIILTSGNYSNKIQFPSGTATYTIKLIALPGTEIQGSNKYVISKSISKLGSDATVTFQAATTNTSNYATFPTTTSTDDINSNQRFTFDWDIANRVADAYGFGLRLTGPYTTINENHWYFETTDTVDGAITSGTEVVIDDLTDIGVGMIISGVSGGSLSGTPSIVSIDTVNKILTISTAQTFADGITLTFKAFGSAAIKNAIGMNIEFEQYPQVTPETLTKTVRTDTADSTTINLLGTYGITGGGHASILGFGVDQASDGPTTVTSVSASSSAGSIVVSTTQGVIPAGTVLTFKDVYETINFKGIINITQFPTTNITIYLNIDELITIGTIS